MDTQIVEIDSSQIKDWESFHKVFKETFGFPDFYGENLNAWIDCMADLDDPDSEMTKITVQENGVVILKMNDFMDFKNRSPAQYEALIDCIAFVNFARLDIGQSTVLCLMPIGTSQEE